MQRVYRLSINLLLSAGLALLAACANVQVDTAPVDKFKEGNYRSYSWRGAPIENTGGSSDPLYVVSPALRAAVDEELADKGYVKRESGGDFTIEYQFKASLADGALNSTAAMADNRYPRPTGGAVINRGTDQALIDNAYALSGVREMNSILLRFSDAESQSLVWAGAVSKIVEDANNDDREKMVKSIRAAVKRVLGQIPSVE